MGDESSIDTAACQPLLAHLTRPASGHDSNDHYLVTIHVEHWSRNGETSLDNLMLLCTKHHTLVHEGGFRIGTDFQNNWIFLRPDGIAVPETG